LNLRFIRATCSKTHADLKKILENVPTHWAAKELGTPVVVMFAGIAVVAWSFGFAVLTAGRPLGFAVDFWLTGLVSFVGGWTCWMLKNAEWNVAFEVYMVSTVIRISVCCSYGLCVADDQVVRHRSQVAFVLFPKSMPSSPSCTRLQPQARP